MEQKFVSRFMYDRDKYQLIIDYFSYILNNNFLLALTYFSEGKGYGYDYTGVNFAVTETKEFIVIFYDFDYEIYVDLSMFINSLKLSAEIYLEENPSSKNEVIKLFELTCKNLLSNK